MQKNKIIMTASAILAGTILIGIGLYKKIIKLPGDMNKDKNIPTINLKVE